MERPARVLEVKGRRFLLGTRAWVMGIVNVTPDSFSDGGAFSDPERAIAHGLGLACAGADIIDVGGESTRPGSRPIAEKDERQRVLPVIRALRRQTGVLLSIDTTKAPVAAAALDEGADIVNDISAMRFDAAMPAAIVKAGAGVILMHMQGTPATMQTAPHYDDLIGSIRDFFRERIAAATAAGIPESAVIIDPGIGFGKTFTHNLTLLNRLDAFHDIGRPLCIGPSRKAFIGAILGLPVEQRLEGTLAAAVIGLCRGADILRVHDVAETAKAARVAEAILGSGAAPVQAEACDAKDRGADVH